MDWKNYEVEGQLSITDYLKSQIELRKVDDFTTFLNKQGKSQYQQILDIVIDTYEKENESSILLNRIANNVSVYVLNQSIEYSKYLREQSQL